MTARYPQSVGSVVETDPIASAALETAVETLSAAVASRQLASTAATDAELEAAVGTIDAALDGRATDTELAAAVATLNTGLASKQSADTAATDAELTAAMATINAAVSTKQDAATAATDAELVSGLAAKQDAATAATDAEVAGAVAGLVLSASATGTLALGAASRTSDVATSRLLVRPSADDENGITIKVPSAGYGLGQPYGKGQPFMVERLSSSPTDIGYDGTSGDLVIFRIPRDGSMGMAGNIHLATGFRQPSTYVSNYCMFVNPHVDATGIFFKHAVGIGSQTQPWLAANDSADNELFRVAANGNGTFGKDTSGRGMMIGTSGVGAGYMAVGHSSVFNATDYALLQGPTGDTIVNSAAGKTTALRIANATRFSVSDTLVAAQVDEFRVASNKLGFYSTAGVTKQSVSGSRGGNAALTSLLTALAAMGLVTNSSTA